MTTSAQEFSHSKLMTAYKVVLIDIDGCLRPPLPFVLDADVLHVLRNYNRRSGTEDGPVISLVSGRSQSDLQLLLELIDSPIPGICENGAACVFPGVDDVIVDGLVTPESLESLAALKDEVKVLVKDRMVTIRSGREWSITLCATEREHLPRIREFCDELIIRRGYRLHCLTSARCIDILPKGIDKGVGVIHLAEYLGCSLSDVVGIGDSAGDIPFLERVGYSACPNNAEASVKNVTSYVAKSDFAAGVIEILTHLIN